MRKFILNNLKIFILLFVYLTLLQLVISLRVYNKSINGQDNLNQIFNCNADVICVGNSRCITTFMPSVFKSRGISLVNLGLHGHPSLNYIDTRISDYLARNIKKPKLVLITIDVFTSSNDKSSNMKDRFARYAFLPNNIDMKIVNYFDFNLAEKYIPSYALLKYRKVWDALLLNNQSQWLKFGMETESSSICDNESTFSKNVIIANYRDKKYDNFLSTQLLMLKNKYNKMGIELIAIQVPVFETVFNNRFNSTKIICKNANVNCIDLAINNFNRDCSLFKDLNHLNTKGAKIVSDSIANFLKLKFQKELE